MTDHADRPTPRVAFYGRTNQLSQNGDRDIARQYRMRLAVLPGPLIGFYYDSGVDAGDDAHARVSASRDAGGPPRWDRGNDELTARLNCPDADIDAVLLAAADRLPRQSARCERLQEAADRHGRQVLTASELSTPDSDGRLCLAVDAARRAGCQPCGSCPGLSMPGEARDREPDSGRLAPGHDPGRWEDQTLTQWIRRLERPADWPAHGTLRGLLLDGPDLLAAEWADNCLRADSGAIITRWWESPPPTARLAGVASGNG